METNHRKKLYRSRKDRVFAGLCGGLADFFNVDATPIRLVWTLVVVFTGFAPGVLVYILAIFIVPQEPVHAS
jgi:phage shock protein C